MTKSFSVAVVVVTFLAACASGTPERSGVPGQLSSEAELAAIAGKGLLFQDHSKIFIGGGKISGTFQNEPIAGTYEMRDGFVCRVITKSSNGPLPEDCQLMVLDGDEVTVTRDRGKGRVFTYKLG